MTDTQDRQHTKSDTTQLRTTLLAIALIGLVAGGLLVTSGGAVGESTTGTQDTEQAATFVVDMETSGDATVAVSYTFDLDDNARQAAFEDLQTNETAHETLTADFEQRLDRVVTETETATNREMTVSDATLTVETVDDTGVATLAVTWQSLAAVEDDRLVVTEPFASGFETDRPLHVVMPEDYTQTTATPAPDASDEDTVTWAAGSDLSGFELVASPADDDSMDDGSTDSTTADNNDNSSETDGDTSDNSDTTAESADTDSSGTDDNGAGFGVLTALLAATILGSVLLSRLVREN